MRLSNLTQFKKEGKDGGEVRELIYEKSWGGKWKRYFTCIGDSHIWRRIAQAKINDLTINKEICVDCERYRIMVILEKWTYL